MGAMNHPANPVDGLVDAKRQAIAEAERALDRLHIELATLEQARNAVAPLTKRRGVRQKGNGRRGRSLSEVWKKVLQAIGARGDAGATNDEVVAFCTASGITVQRHTLRSQLANYVRRGWLDRPNEGKVRLTPAGAKIAGAPANRDKDAPLSGGAP